MILGTVRLHRHHASVRIDEGYAVVIGEGDLAALMKDADWRERAESASGPRINESDLEYAPLVVAPEKVLCVGLNYRTHILEMGRDVPPYPTLFAKFARSLTSSRDPILLPARSNAPDWEAELALVIGAAVRNADDEAAREAIAGFTVFNDVTMRDWQYRTKQWLQGKTFEATSPIGPWLDTEGDGSGRELVCELNGEIVQRANTADLVFDCVTLVRYVSSFITLSPGDVIATGTPGGVGHARTPPRYLRDGDTLQTRIDGLGEARNVCVAELR